MHQHRRDLHPLLGTSTGAAAPKPRGQDQFCPPPGSPTQSLALNTGNAGLCPWLFPPKGVATSSMEAWPDPQRCSRGWEIPSWAGEGQGSTEDWNPSPI